MLGRVGVICAVALGVASLAGCDSRVVAGSPVTSRDAGHSAAGAPPIPDRRAFCAAVHRAARAIPRSHGDLHVVLRSFERMNAVAPAAISPDTSYVVNTVRHALATHQTPDLTVLGQHSRAVAQWAAAHCDGA